MENIERKNKTENFYNRSFANALNYCRRSGFHFAFAPEIVNLRLKDRRWGRSYATQSIRATGYTKYGSKVDVYVHTEHWFSKSKKIRVAYKNHLHEPTPNGAARMPQKEFNRLVELDEKTNELGDRLVWVVDHGDLWRAQSKVMTIEEALEHPQTIPFIGDGKKAEIYLTKHKERYGDKIGVWYFDDLTAEPRARPLFFGSHHLGLDSAFNFFSDGRVLGIKDSKAPALLEVLKTSQSTDPGVSKTSTDFIISRLQQGYDEGRKWKYAYTRGEKEMLRALVAEGASLEQMASKLGRAILSIFYELKTQSRKDPNQLGGKTLEKYQQEVDAHQQRLAEYYRNPPSSQDWPRKRDYTPQELGLLKEEIEKGRNLEELANTLKRPKAGLVMKLRKLSQQNPEQWKPEAFRKYQWELNHHL